MSAIGRVDRIVNCNEVDACMSASSEQLGMAMHKYDCHSVTALHLARGYPALGFSAHTPSEWVVATV